MKSRSEFIEAAAIGRLAAALALTVAASAQTSRGTISGTVTDPSGAVVSRATVAISHTETGARRVTTTNEAGIYRFDAVDLGGYELKVTHPGSRRPAARNDGECIQPGRGACGPIGVKIRSHALLLRTGHRQGACGLRFLGEFCSRAMFSSVRIVFQAPSSRMAPRSAHSVMRNRDQALWV